MRKSSVKTLLSTATIVLAACLFVEKPANALLMLSLDDGLGNTASVTDTDGDGLLTFTGSLGSWLANVSTGVANPLIGSPSINALDLASVNVSGGEGTLTIMLTNTGYDGSASRTSYLTGVGGTTDGDVMFQSYIDTTNTAFGMGTLLNDTGIMSGIAFSSSNGGSVMTSDLYSLTTVATLSLSGVGDLTSFDYTIKVPEATSLTLFGIGLFGLAFIRRREKVLEE